MNKSMRRCVLLSGGLDSTAALHWAIDSGGPVNAIGFDYGQPHANAELSAARNVVNRLGINFAVIHLPGLASLDPSSGLDARGLSCAFVPGRNAVFLASAASYAARSGSDVLLVVGANKDDARGFPDCRTTFFQMQEQALTAAFDGMCSVWIATPWLSMPKSGIVEWCASRGAALEDIRASVSCYRGIRCGQCDACMFRRLAFKTAGVSEGGE